MQELILEQEAKRKKRIKLFSKAAFAIFSLSSLPDFWFKNYKTGLISILIGLIFGLIHTFTDRYKSKYLGTFLSLLTNAGIFMSSLLLGDLSRAYLYYIPLFIATFLVIDYRDKVNLFFNIFHIVLGIFVIDIFNLVELLGIQQEIDPDKVHKYGVFNTFLAMTASIYFLLLFIREITHNEERLYNIQYNFKLQNEELLKKNDELDRLIYSISHDIKSPLASISGLAYIARLETNNPKLVEYFDRLDLSAKKLKMYVENIINYYKNTKFEIQKDQVFFEDEIRSILENFNYHPLYNEINITVVVNQNQAFITDRLRIQTILINLISNAIKYQNEKEKNKKIDILAKIEDHTAIIEVSDNGMGIGPEIKDKVFNMFYRGNIKSDGSGLGLYILRETLHKMGGTVTFESEKEKYTKFTVRIPEQV